MALAVKCVEAAPMPSCMHRVKSMEPGQRIMTEAIAFLFSYYGPLYAEKSSSFITPTPEEFFAYVKYLNLQTYYVFVPVIRRKLSKGFLPEQTDIIKFVNLLHFFDFIEKLEEKSLTAYIIQAHNIGLRALSTYLKFIDEITYSEPFNWFTSILMYSSIEYKTYCSAVSNAYLENCINYLNKNVAKKRLMFYFKWYTVFYESNVFIFSSLRRFLDKRLAC